MKTYNFHDPNDPRYAEAFGRWTSWTERGLCPGCTAQKGKPIPPLVIEWERGSDVVGDFTWLGFGSIVVVVDRVRRVFEQRFRCAFRPIEMRQSPKLKRPQRVTKRTVPRVWLPYKGPPLWELLPVAEVPLDLSRSNWVLEKTCPVCGAESWNITSRPMRAIVCREQWSGDHIFRFVHQKGEGVVYCTEKVKDVVESEGFTNVSFVESGRID